MMKAVNFFTQLFGHNEFHNDFRRNQQDFIARARFVDDDIIAGWQKCLISSVSQGDCAIDAGVFRFDNVKELRGIAFDLLKKGGYTEVNFKKGHSTGDSRVLHSKHHGGLFQAASQFNCLEFGSPDITPEAGITIYQHDHTQGPSCAIACAGATAFRNYLVPVNQQEVLEHDWKIPPQIPPGEGAKYGQTVNLQLNGIADIEPIIWNHLGNNGDRLWNVRNGYIELTKAGSEMLPHLTASCNRNPALEQDLIDLIRVGCQFDSEVTDVRIKSKSENESVPFVQANAKYASQVFASACSIGYSQYAPRPWEPLARIVLKAAYEATYYAYIIHKLRLEHRTMMGSDIPKVPTEPLFLTKLGGGVFANPHEWILDAMEHAESQVQVLFHAIRLEAGEDETRTSLTNLDNHAPTTKHVVSGYKKSFQFDVLVTHYGRIDTSYDTFVNWKSSIVDIGRPIEVDEKARLMLKSLLPRRGP